MVSSFEVIDLLSREVVATPIGPFVGWAQGDAWLIDGHRDWGRLLVQPTLLSRAGDPGGSSLRIPHGGHCHACPSWVDAPMMLDIDNGVVAMLYARRATVTSCTSWLAAGCSDGRSFGRVITRDYEVAPVGYGPGWQARGAIRFSHVYDPRTERNAKEFTGQDWFEKAKPLADMKLSHRTLEGQAAMRITAISGGTVVRGDWRSAVRGPADTVTPTSSPARLLAEVRQFTRRPDANRASTIADAPRSPREEVPYSNSMGDGMWAIGVSEEQRKVMEARIDAQQGFVLWPMTSCLLLTR